MCYRELKYGRLLAGFQEVQKNNLAVWKFQRVVMRAGLVFVDLTEDGCLMFSRASTPGPQTQTPDFFRER
jgi:hypothetical protein